jgi:hypothetical protein
LSPDKDSIPKRMDEKISYFAKELPEYLVENKSIYGLLSKGIHELKEQECLKHFETLKDAIFFILEENKQKKEKEQEKKDVSKNINKISQEIQNRSDLGE